MSIRCRHFGANYDITLFEFGRKVCFKCGNLVTLGHEESRNNYSYQREEHDIRLIRQAADRISFLIVNTDYPLIDIEIEKQHLKEYIEQLMPDRAYLYNLLYEPRFRRLEEQFRRG